MYIKVHVTAGAKKESFEKVSDECFNIAVKEPAEKNRANKRVIDLLVGFYTVNRGAVRIINGHHSPNKIFDIYLEST